MTPASGGRTDFALYLQSHEYRAGQVYTHFSFLALSVTGCFPLTDVSSTTLCGSQFYGAKDEFETFLYQQTAGIVIIKPHQRN